MLIHFPKLPLGSRITPRAAQHSIALAQRDRAHSTLHWQHSATRLPCKSSFAWAEEEKFSPVLLDLGESVHTALSQAYPVTKALRAEQAPVSLNYSFSRVYLL